MIRLNLRKERQLLHYYYYVYTSNTAFKVYGLDELLYSLGEPGVHCV